MGGGTKKGEDKRQHAWQLGVGNWCRKIALAFIYFLINRFVILKYPVNVLIIFTKDYKY